MTSWMWRAAVVVTVLGLVGCSSGDGMTPTAPSAGRRVAGGAKLEPDDTGREVGPRGDQAHGGVLERGRREWQRGMHNDFGRARVEAGRLSVGPLGSTMMACGRDGVMEQETLYLSSLQTATSYTLQGGELRLGPSSGEVTLVFASR